MNTEVAYPDVVEVSAPEACASSKKNMSLLGKALEAPSYGFEKNGELVVPSQSELWSEFFSRLNLFKSKKNWLSVLSWFAVVVLAGFFFTYLFGGYFSWSLTLVAMVYSMVVLGTHGTIFLHRYSTHRAFKFKNNFARFLVRNLTIKIIPEEIYVISHHVHHHFSEKPGDPYNVHGGWLYCFLADVNHQAINRNLSECEYASLVKLMSHTGVRTHSYAQYQKYGTLANPFRTLAHFVLNWAFWFGAFTLIGGVPLAMAIFGCAVIWAVGVRTYNYEGHGKGSDRRQDGIDFNRKDWSVNQVWPGYVAGEWHNNHHLYPNGAKSGFLPYQLDLAWQFIRFCHFIGAVESYKDYQDDFMEKHYIPYIQARDAEVAMVNVD